VLRRYSRGQDGQTTAELALLLALCAIGLLVALYAFRAELSNSFRGSAKEVASFKPPVVACDANYAGACVPPYPPDVDCSDLEALGIGDVVIKGSDPHDLDPDGDGIGCD
jgi:Flp pilus assembly pilin Flp